MGRVLVIEFDEQDTPVFEEIMRALKQHPAFERMRLNNDTILELPGLKIYPDSRKIFCGRREVNLTTKEYELLCLLVANKGIVLTYERIYQNVWGEEGPGNESTIVGCHMRNLRGKLYAASPDPSFTIRCVREVGYCLEIDKTRHKTVRR